jgi:hypothetical protein
LRELLGKLIGPEETYYQMNRQLPCGLTGNHLFPRVATVF